LDTNRVVAADRNIPDADDTAPPPLMVVKGIAVGHALNVPDALSNEQAPSSGGKLLAIHFVSEAGVV
jgi:hypothetical protein